VADADGEGTLTGRVAILSIEDSLPALAFDLHLPLRIDGESAALHVDLRHPQARSWRQLGGRSYRFDASTARFAMSDGERCRLDDVFGGIRTADGALPTRVTAVRFGDVTGTVLAVRVEASVTFPDGSRSLAVDATVRAGSVEAGSCADAEWLLELADYEEPVMASGRVVYEPCAVRISHDA
jgi:hypothetical protein